MSLQKLLVQQNYDHKICGMPKSLATFTRKHFIQEKSTEHLLLLKEKTISHLKTRLPSENFSVGLVAGGAVHDCLKESDLNEEIIIFLLSDITDVDSKMVTFVKHGVNTKIFEALYKFPISLD
eukprot:TRINITY_DN352_c0_g1_i2.p1 TRINITY_DN352_c0_g1~~TRINITY_DN352_c0_g1_i2.p1  ORF type:complete len:123 (-),score=22.67 TRINITY_DN352_c0_g1_i2:186-554(-)